MPILPSEFHLFVFPEFCFNIYLYDEEYEKFRIIKGRRATQFDIRWLI